MSNKGPSDIPSNTPSNERLMMIYGVHAVSAALKSGHGTVREVWVDQARRDQRIIELLGLCGEARNRHVIVHRVSREALDEQVDDARHQGVSAQIIPKLASSFEELKQLLARLEVPPFLLVLDGVQDPHNLGACMRTADAFGVHAIIAPRDRAVSMNATVSKVACGAAERVPLIQVTNLARTLKALKDEGLWIIGTDAQAPQSVHGSDLSGPTALVMGGEAKGMRRLTRSHCDMIVGIDMSGAVESLNISVAAGIFMCEIARQHRLAAAQHGAKK